MLFRPNVKRTSWHLRTYTREFGAQMASMLPGMLESEPQPAQRDATDEELEHLWGEGLDYGDRWDDAGLSEVVKYLLGARGLKVPSKWEWLLPHRL